MTEIETAASFMLSNNFDSVTKPCFLTLLKLVDNILSKPGHEAVRRVKFSNAIIQQKIGGCKGGVEFLYVCGFSLDRNSTTSTVGITSSTTGLASVVAAARLQLGTTENTTAPPTLVLLPANEDTKQLVAARRLLEQHLLRDLGCTEDDVPRFRPPPPPVVVLNEASASCRGTQNTVQNEFNPYQGQRFDALSASVGTRLGPDANYTSKTEAELERLRQHQQQLQAETKQVQDREWIVTVPGQTTAAAAAAPTAPTAPTSDASLLAARAQTQQLERVQRETGGFTTAAMRDLVKLKRQKVYAHVAVLVQCPDGTRLTGKFGPHETIQAVMDALQTECWTRYDITATTARPEFDLYVTPPRRLLQSNVTLTEAGLVPAAKVFLSWKGATAQAASSSSILTWLDPTLRPNSDNANIAAHFPASVPVVSAAATAASHMDVDNDEKKPAAKKLTKEERLLQRMMGGVASLGGGGASAKDAPGKPKWMK